MRCQLMDRECLLLANRRSSDHLPATSGLPPTADIQARIQKKSPAAFRAQCTSTPGPGSRFRNSPTARSIRRHTAYRGTGEGPGSLHKHLGGAVDVEVGYHWATKCYG